MSVEIEVLEDPAKACAAILLGAAADGGQVVLTGGSTPRKAYEELANAVQAVGLDLTSTTFWFGDERCVPPDDDRSNYLLAKRSLFDPLGGANEPRVQRMKGEFGAEAGAEDYERSLREAGAPRFDLVLLGLGPDAHIASLFPDQSTLDERERLVVGVPEAGFEPYVPRVSLTLPALTNSEAIVFLVAGSSKAEAVAKAFGPAAEPDRHIPASVLAPLAQKVTVLLDPAAAERL
jgi:6-phosphogluconolactonase